MNNLIKKINNLPGPILVLGASGFIGANLFRALKPTRDDVFGTSSTLTPWRLSDFGCQNIEIVDLLVDHEVDQLVDKVKPKTVFNCVAYGAYSFQEDVDLIYRTNFFLVVKLLERLSEMRIKSFIHAGTSSEYGRNAAGPSEGNQLAPNSHYAISKASASNAISFFGTEQKMPCVNLRIYSAYGPLEDSSRLIPQLLKKISVDDLPSFVDANISRDFVYIDDVVEVFIDTALNVEQLELGQAYNVASGKKTTIGELAQTARDLFSIVVEPNFEFEKRGWDVKDWYGNPTKINDALGWESSTNLVSGLRKTKDWYDSLSAANLQIYLDATKKTLTSDATYSISAVIACYGDELAIPVMYERLTKCLTKLNVDYELIFVNDGSPDRCEEVIREITSNDRRVFGISHSRNFGSQSAFLSGMKMARKNSVVLLDGDLQDPPELIEKFVDKWKKGFEVVYGRRIKRETQWYMSLSYKMFYRLFDKFSFIKIPHDAGDFSLIDIKVVHHLLGFPERDIFLRGVRAFVGFKQVGVDYARPKRLFGRSTNSFRNNIQWAKKGFFSFSYTPLNLLTAFSVVLFLATSFLFVFQIVAKALYPGYAPEGITTLMLINLGFGSLTLLAISLVGEYIARIFEEVKQRPQYIRKAIIQNGEIRKI